MRTYILAILLMFTVANSAMAGELIPRYVPGQFAPLDISSVSAETAKVDETASKRQAYNLRVLEMVYGGDKMRWVRQSVLNGYAGPFDLPDPQDIYAKQRQALDQALGLPPSTPHAHSHPAPTVSPIISACLDVAPPEFLNACLKKN